jgi:hypothetical protein
MSTIYIVRISEQRRAGLPSSCESGLSQYEKETGAEVSFFFFFLIVAKGVGVLCEDRTFQVLSLLSARKESASKHSVSSLRHRVEKEEEGVRIKNYQ